MIKYHGYTVAGQEVPGEISLCLIITNCPHCCEGCFSPELRKDIGVPVKDDILRLLSLYASMITCVAFMGEGNNPTSLWEM